MASVGLRTAYVGRATADEASPTATNGSSSPLRRLFERKTPSPGEQNVSPAGEATPREWADAFLAQARVDLEAARLVEAVPSVFAMVLQMTFEKLAKAALLRSGATALSTATTTHRAASRMIRAPTPKS
jgi:hypothetical protein